MDYHSLHATFLFLISGVIAFGVPRRTLDFVLLVTAWINILLIAFGWVTQSIFGYQIQGNPFNHPWGVLMNPSMSGCLAVCLMPMLLNHRVTLYCSALAVMLCGEDQPWVLLALGSFIFLWQRRSEYLGYAGLSLLASVLWAIAGGVQSSGRFEVWKLAWDWWSRFAYPIQGTGSGGFAAIGPVLTRKLDTLWIWLHSDWLQIGFEQGILGLIFALLVLWKLIQSTREKPEVRLGVVLYALWMCANMPMRFMVSAILGLYWIRLSLESDLNAKV